MTEGAGRPGLWSMPGEGVLARQGDLVLLSGVDEQGLIDKLLGVLAETSESGGDGRRFAAAIEDVLQNDETWGGGQQGPAVVAFGPAGAGLAAVVSGGAWAEVTTAQGTDRLAASQPSTVLRCVVGVPVQAVRAGLGTGGSTGRTDRFSFLERGSVRAGGLSYRAGTVPAPAGAEPGPAVPERGPAGAESGPAGLAEAAPEPVLPEELPGEPLRAEPLRAEPLRAEPLRGGSLRGGPVQPGPPAAEPFPAAGGVLFTPSLPVAGMAEPAPADMDAAGTGAGAAGADVDAAGTGAGAAGADVDAAGTGADEAGTDAVPLAAAEPVPPAAEPAAPAAEPVPPAAAEWGPPAGAEPGPAAADWGPPAGAEPGPAAAEWGPPAAAEPGSAGAEPGPAAAEQVPSAAGLGAPAGDLGPPAGQFGPSAGAIGPSAAEQSPPVPAGLLAAAGRPMTEVAQIPGFAAGQPAPMEAAPPPHEPTGPADIPPLPMAGPLPGGPGTPHAGPGVPLAGPGAPSAGPGAAPGPPIVIGVYCKNGHFGDPEARSCAVCGVSSHRRAQVPQPGPRPPLGALILADGSVMPLDTDYVIGREPGQDPAVTAGEARPLRIVDAEMTVSRVHARIHLEGWQVFLIDLGSANGTRIQPPGRRPDQELAPNVPVPLQSGTEVFVGTQGFLYQLQPAAARP